MKSHVTFACPPSPFSTSDMLTHATSRAPPSLTFPQNIPRFYVRVKQDRPRHKQLTIMAPISLSDIVSALPSEDSWGPPTSTDTTLDGVPYAPYSKGDKLGRMADWTAEGKDGRDGRGGRQQYNRNYRGANYGYYVLESYSN